MDDLDNAVTALEVVSERVNQLQQQWVYSTNFQQFALNHERYKNICQRIDNVKEKLNEA